jgi:hypothetical protein
VFCGSGPEAGLPADGVPVAAPVAAPPGAVGAPGAPIAAPPGPVGVVALGAAAEPLLSCLVEPCAITPDEVPSASRSVMTKALFMAGLLFRLTGQLPSRGSVRAGGDILGGVENMVHPVREESSAPLTPYLRLVRAKQRAAESARLVVPAASACWRDAKPHVCHWGDRPG